MAYNLLKGKKGLIFGALNEQSIAWKVAQRAVEEGAEIVLTNTPVSIRMGTINELATACNAPVIPADATNVKDLENLIDKCMEHFGGKFDFILHSIGMSPNVRKGRTYDDLDYDFLTKTLDISAISFHKVIQVARKKDAINDWGSIVALTYMFTFAAIYKFWNYIQADPRFLVASLCLFAFVTEVNGICNNLLRQQFAMSMMLYAIIERCTNGRILYPLLVISFFTHTMTGFFIPFLFIRLGKKASFRFYIYIVLGFGLLYILFTNLSIFSSSSFYAFQRLATASNAYALKDIIQPSAVYPFLAVTVILYVKAFFFDSERRKCELYINNLFLILISMCLLMTSMPLMQTRYFIIRFFFMPLVVPYFFTAKGSLCDYYLITVPLCFAFRFFSTPSIWLASSNDIVYRSIFDYL